MSGNSCVVHGEAAQEALGGDLAGACGGRPALIFLSGELGAGKTTLTRGFLRALGHEGSVKSPTYTLIEPYRLADSSVYHLDLYRVADPEELEFLGLRELLAEAAVVLVEWPERGRGWLPAPDLAITLAHLPDGREIRFEAASPRGQEILDNLGDKLPVKFQKDDLSGRFD